jgi:hypothetical protein
VQAVDDLRPAEGVQVVTTAASAEEPLPSCEVTGRSAVVLGLRCMVRQNLGVPVTEPVEQACRAFDVREEEGNGARRELAHRRV